ncbi:MAG: response regulator transcription factor [Clostridiales bacterium]|nr:response regulator transcription factor [Clostridiales bacterium]
MRVRILVIDDEESICEILKYNLEKEGYDVDTVYSAEEALTLDIKLYQLLIVDIMMDRMSGFDLVKRLKNSQATERIPVIFCSALSGEDDTVMGLNIGADDYIRKPFNIGEVVARVRSVLRRSQIGEQTATHIKEGNYEPDITFKTLRIDRNQKQCFINGKLVQLTRNEFDILLFFLEHRNRIHSRQDIIQNVWGKGAVVVNRSVDVNIARLRGKLGEYVQHITTRPGFGYGFKEEI